MKRKILVTLGILSLFLVLTACGKDAANGENVNGGEEAPAVQETVSGDFNVGVTLQNLANPFWAGVFGNVEPILDEKGIGHTILNGENSAATQISQIENFISVGKDLIMVHPADPHALEDVLGQARDAGILVMSWDDILENSDLNWVLDNEELGFEIGRAAAEFINEHYSADSPAEVAIINHPATPILAEREAGIIRGLEELAGDNFVIVARQPALEAGEAMSHIETILQAHPNLTIVAGIGAGADIGANEAFMAHFGGNIPEYVGVFSADASEQTMRAILAGEASRVSVGFEGSALRTAREVSTIFEQLLNGYEFPERDIVRIKTPIDIHNVAEFLADYE